MNVAIENRMPRDSDNPKACRRVRVRDTAAGRTAGGDLRGTTRLLEDDRLQRGSQESLASIALHGAAHLTAGDHRPRVVFGRKQVKDVCASHELVAFIVDLAKILTASERSWDHRTHPGFRTSQDQADTRLRPLARRRFKIRRPPLVELRLRKPCVRARLMLLG